MIKPILDFERKIIRFYSGMLFLFSLLLLTQIVVALYMHFVLVFCVFLNSLPLTVVFWRYAVYIPPRGYLRQISTFTYETRSKINSEWKQQLSLKIGEAVFLDEYILFESNGVLLPYSEIVWCYDQYFPGHDHWRKYGPSSKITLCLNERKGKYRICLNPDEVKRRGVLLEKMYTILIDKNENIKFGYSLEMEDWYNRLIDSCKQK